MECVLLIGLPASGKTTFYHERFAGSHVHVSKDLMRNTRRRDERQARLIADALDAGGSIVVDNTNVSAAERAPLIALARAHGAEVVGYVFESDAVAALRRNRQREGRERIPAVAIFAARKRFEPPRYEEGFDRLYTVTLREEDRSFDVRPLPR